MARLAMRWRAAPPGGFVCAAGVTTASPSIARLLRCVAELPQGLVVLPGLGIDMPEAEWQALGPHAPDPDTGRRARSIETHPQFQLKLLLDRTGIHRGEVSTLPEGWGHDARAIRGPASAHSHAPSHSTRKRNGPAAPHP